MILEKTINSDPSENQQAQQSSKKPNSDHPEKLKRSILKKPPTSDPEKLRSNYPGKTTRFENLYPLNDQDEKKVGERFVEPVNAKN